MSPETGQLARIEMLLEALGRRGADIQVDEEAIVFRSRIDGVAVRMIVDDDHLVLHLLDHEIGPEEWRLSLRHLGETMVHLRHPGRLQPVQVDQSGSAETSEDDG